eukprot:scaffold49640_cov87-Phaeocystis_antarctica.AAC.2
MDVLHGDDVALNVAVPWVIEHATLEAAACHPQLGNNTDSCQPCHSSKAGEASTIDDEAASIDIPLEDIVHIEDVSRTTAVATILEVVSRRLDRLGYKGLSLSPEATQPSWPERCG